MAERFASALATELRAVGIRSTTRRCSTCTRIRRIRSSAIARWPNAPKIVARLGTAIIRTLQGEGIAACGKHFPGHGDTSTDSHFDLPRLDHPLDRLDAVELVPFRAAAAADVASIMTAHVLMPARSTTSLQRRCPGIVDGLLKKKLGYRGRRRERRPGDESDQRGDAVTVEAMVLAVLAGCDAVLLCNQTPDEQVDALRGHRLRGRGGRDAVKSESTTR